MPKIDTHLNLDKRITILMHLSDGKSIGSAMLSMTTPISNTVIKPI